MCYSFRRGDKDLGLPEPLKPYEQEVSSQVNPGKDAVIYLPSDKSQMAVAASVIQAHIWYANDLQEERGKVAPGSPIPGSPRRRKRHESGDEKSYSILVVVPEWKSVEEVSSCLMVYLPHLKVAQHGGTSHQKGGLQRQIFSADVIVSHTKTVSNCLEAKSIFLCDLTLLVSLYVNKTNYHDNLAAFGGSQKKGGNPTQKLTVLSSIPEPENTAEMYDCENLDQILSDLSGRRIVYVKKNKAALYQELLPGVCVVSLTGDDLDTATSQEALTKLLSTCYGSHGYIHGKYFKPKTFYI